MADIDTDAPVRPQTGEPKGEVALKGATFANDVAAGPDGNIYVSDSGLNAKFEGTGTDSIWVIKPGKKPTAKQLIKSKDLHGPNGLLVTKDAVHVVVFGGPELQTYDLKGKKKGEFTMLPNGGLDGIVAIGDDLLITSWGARPSTAASWAASSSRRSAISRRRPTSASTPSATACWCRASGQRGRGVGRRSKGHAARHRAHGLDLPEGPCARWSRGVGRQVPPLRQRSWWSSSMAPPSRASPSSTSCRRVRAAPMSC